jgi:aminoglycoside phosphotransferase (APT) family kinase protein
MLYLSAQSSIPVPTVYALYGDLETTETFIVMGRVPGTALGWLWHHMTVVQKERFAVKLMTVMEAVRALPMPTGVDDSAKSFLPDCESSEGETAAHGSSEIQTGLHALMTNFVLGTRRKMAEWDNSRGMVFSYGDVQGGNIVVTRLDADDFDFVVIDWELSGWYPVGVSGRGMGTFSERHSIAALHVVA